MPTIWAYSKNVPGKTCEDARLLGGGTKLQYPAGNHQGQAGWDMGLMFNDIFDLMQKIQKLDLKEKITRLAINVHGSPGKIDADSIGTEAAMYDFRKLLHRFSSPLACINQFLAGGATVLIMGCNVGKADEGAEFLNVLSSIAFPSSKVVGFTTIGETLGQFRHGEYCSEPGMRDTPYDNPSEGFPAIKAEREKEYLTLPWASENSPHAKVSYKGKIIAGAEPPVPHTDYSAGNYAPGRWGVTIGPWEGFFVFEAQGSVYWTDKNPSRRHQGSWCPFDGSIIFSFDDDPPGRKRQFDVVLPLKSTVNGKIYINAIDHGFFTMSKLN